MVQVNSCPSGVKEAIQYDLSVGRLEEQEGDYYKYNSTAKETLGKIKEHFAIGDKILTNDKHLRKNGFNLFDRSFGNLDLRTPEDLRTLTPASIFRTIIGKSYLYIPKEQIDKCK